MGWFEHGSTIVVLAPQTMSLADKVETGMVIRQGQPLLRLHERATSALPVKADM